MMEPKHLHLPAALWRVVQALAPHDGDANTIILRALEEGVRHGSGDGL